MLPEASTTPAFHLPDGARAPMPEEIDEEGFGYFRNVWYISPGQPRDEARALLRWERSVVAAIDGLADSAEAFDELAHVVEEFNTDSDHRRVEESEYPDLTEHERDVLEACLDTGDELLDGLELGVAALVFALAASGFHAAASCRGHASSTAWSDRPTVFFAGEREHIGQLEAAVLASGSRLEDGSVNGNGLVVIRAPSLTAAMNLADAILELGLTPPANTHEANVPPRLDELL